MRIQFWSSTEYGGFLAGLIRELNSKGVETEQCFAISEDSYRNAHSWLARKWLRVQQYILYPLHLILSLLVRKKADVIVVCTNTFYAPLVATFLHKRVIHLVYDLYPEALVHAGKLDGDGWAAGVIHRITQATLNRSSANVFLGERLREYVKSTYRLEDAGVVIPVGADDSLFRLEELSPLDETIILYCGNFGHMHDVDTLFQAWKRLVKPPPANGLETGKIRWRFQSSGPRFNELMNTVRRIGKDASIQIEVGPGLGQEAWIEVMESAGIALVTMVPGSEEVVMPSKSYSALAAGQALLAIAPESSDLVALIKEHGCGWWVAPGDVDGLIDRLTEITLYPEEVHKRRKASLRAAREHFSQSALAGMWIQLFQQV